MGWVFQGNPDHFDVDEYLSCCPQLIYWRTRQHKRQIHLGDRAFIWRSGRPRKTSGAIAIGRIVELPKPAREVDHPEVLGDDLWIATEADPDETTTGIRLEDVKLLPEDGMVSWLTVEADPVLAKSTLIRIPRGTVFKLSDAETAALERLWGALNVKPSAEVTVLEGEMRLRAHFVRERSSRLRRDKLEEMRRDHGTLACEICGFHEAAAYPPPMQDRAFEVHHRLPLSISATPVRTQLADLAVLCANCHRSVHASQEVVANYENLQAYHRKKRG